MPSLATREAITSDFLPAKSKPASTLHNSRFFRADRAGLPPYYWQLPVAIAALAVFLTVGARWVPLLSLFLPWIWGGCAGATLATVVNKRRDWEFFRHHFRSVYLDKGIVALKASLAELRNGFDERAKFHYYYGNQLAPASLRRQTKELLRHLEPDLALNAAARVESLIGTRELVPLVESLYLGKDEVDPARYDYWCEQVTRAISLLIELEAIVRQDMPAGTRDWQKLSRRPDVAALTRSIEAQRPVVGLMARDAVRQRRKDLGA